MFMPDLYTHFRLGISLLLMLSVQVYDGYLVYPAFIWSVICASPQKRMLHMRKMLNGGEL